MGVFIKKVPINELSTVVRGALPYTHFEKTKYIIVNQEKIYLDSCSQSLKYLFKVLEDKTIPFEEKKNNSFNINGTLKFKNA